MLSVLAIIEFNVGAKDGEQWLPCGADTPRVALSRRLPDPLCYGHMVNHVNLVLCLCLGLLIRRGYKQTGRSEQPTQAG